MLTGVGGFRSYLELIQGVPGVGWFYQNIFRPAFGHLFVGVSYLSCLVADRLCTKDKGIGASKKAE